MASGPAGNTRGKDKPTETDESKMTADELAALRNQLLMKERRMREESAAVAKNRATFEEQVARAQADIDDERAELDQCRLELNREREELAAQRRELEVARGETKILPDAQDVLADFSVLDPPRRSQRSENSVNPPLHPSATPRQSNTRPPHRNHSPEREDSRLVIKAAIESIPSFDGTNICVLQFTRACQRARDLVPRHAEKTLSKLIVSKLRGSAYTAIEDERVDKVADISNRLKDIFGPHHTIDHYRGEMANIYMRANEHILQYISRVKDLRTAIIDCHRDDPDMVEIDVLTKNSFIRGLIPKLRPEVRQVKHRSLRAVFDEAVIHYKDIELDKQRYERHGREEKQVRFTGHGSPNNPRSDSRFSRSPSPYRNNSYQNTSRADTTYRVDPAPNRQRDNSPYQARTDTYTNKSRENRHSESPRDVTRSSNGDNDSRYVRRDTYTPPQRRENNYVVPRAPAKICNYCKIPGHDIHECRKREYANRMREQSGNGSTLPSAANQRREASPKQTVQTIATEPITEEEVRE
ncbi:uncharacterized protein LOC143220224 [Lasioglossum baleicum]|uniref:uncharacterized protein LOC143220224 n=1 Tax=Lasioglossum baleicum TaxID=434251 RepID=UPI003FCD0EC2